MAPTISQQIHLTVNVDALQPLTREDRDCFRCIAREALRTYEDVEGKKDVTKMLSRLASMDQVDDDDDEDDILVTTDPNIEVALAILGHVDGQKDEKEITQKHKGRAKKTLAEWEKEYPQKTSSWSSEFNTPCHYPGCKTIRDEVNAVFCSTTTTAQVQGEDLQVDSEAELVENKAQEKSKGGKIRIPVLTLRPYCSFHNGRYFSQKRAQNTAGILQRMARSICHRMSSASGVDFTPDTAEQEDSDWNIMHAQGWVANVFEAGVGGIGGREALTVPNGDLHVKNCIKRLDEHDYVCAGTGAIITLKDTFGRNFPSLDRLVFMQDEETGRSVSLPYMSSKQRVAITTVHWNFFAGARTPLQRAELLKQIAAGLNEPRRLAATLAQAQADLKKLLPAGHTFSESKVVGTVGLCRMHQTEDLNRGRQFSFALSTESDLIEAMLVTLGVCPLSGMLLSIRGSCDAQYGQWGHNKSTILPTLAAINCWKGSYLWTWSRQSFHAYLRSGEVQGSLQAVKARQGGVPECDELDLFCEVIKDNLTDFVRDGLKSARSGWFPQIDLTDVPVDLLL